MTSQLKTLVAALAATLALGACGGEGGNSPSIEIPLPDVDFPIPEIPDSRPKTGRDALYDVPWTTKAAPKRDGNVMGKSYFLFTKDTMSYVTLCTPIVPIKGKREWIAPTATAKIAFGDKKDSFKTLEEATDKATVGGKSCAVSIPKDITFEYTIEDNGEKLTLKSPQDPANPQELYIFRNN